MLNARNSEFADFNLYDCPDISWIDILPWLLPLGQRTKIEYMRRSEGVLDAFWTSYIRSIYVLCPESFKYLMHNQYHAPWPYSLQFCVFHKLLRDPISTNFWLTVNTNNTNSGCVSILSYEDSHFSNYTHDNLLKFWKFWKSVQVLRKN